MTRSAHPVLRRLRSERGFTLVEVLVAMVAGLIVCGALFAILEVSVRQNARITDRVQSQQIGSNALTRIIDPLRSGCISRGATPVQSGSTGTKLIFTTAFSNETTPKPEQVYKETVELVGTKLWAKTQKATGGSWPTYTGWEEPGNSTLLAENIYEPGGTEPVFRYYKYQEEATSSSTSGYSTLTKLKTSSALTEAEAKTVAGVEVRFEALPQDNYSAQHRGTELMDSVTFALSSPASEGSTTDSPCQ